MTFLMRSLARVLLTVGFISSVAGSNAESDNGQWQLSSTPPGLVIELRSELQPLRINQMHSWWVNVQTPDGSPVQDADIALDGGMPEHNHGLATAPQVVAGDQPGHYEIQGMRFHMPGNWQLRIRIGHEGVMYNALLVFTL